MQMGKQKIKTIKGAVKCLHMIITVKMLTKSENVPRRKVRLLLLEMTQLRLKNEFMPGMVTRAFNPSTQEAEAANLSSRTAWSTKASSRTARTVIQTLSQKSKTKPRTEQNKHKFTV